jgi:hypothetical protein
MLNSADAGTIGREQELALSSTVNEQAQSYTKPAKFSVLSFGRSLGIPFFSIFYL